MLNLTLTQNLMAHIISHLNPKDTLPEYVVVRKIINALVDAVLYYAMTPVDALQPREPPNQTDHFLYSSFSQLPLDQPVEGMLNSDWISGS